MLNLIDNSQNLLLRWLLLGLLIPIVGLNLWVLIKLLEFLQPLITIFTLALVLAFLLNHPVRWFQQHGLPRSLAVLLILLLVSGVIVGLSITLVPRAIEELGQLVMTIPAWVESLNQRLGVLQNWASDHHLPINFSRLSADLTDTLPRQLQAVSDTLINLITNTLGRVSTVFLTLIATFYLLLDVERLWHGMMQWFPSPIAHRAFKLLRKNFRNYFVGQAAIATLTGALVTVVFFALHVPFTILFSVTVWLLAFLPFGDTLSITLFSLFVATQDVGMGVRMFIGAVLAEQVVDQAVAPRLMGSVIGLRPIWVLIALLLGVKVAGLVGVILAVPTVGFLKDMVDRSVVLEPDLTAVAANNEDPLQSVAPI
jgi:predicted PurR-regulated permease PerM